MKNYESVVQSLIQYNAEEEWFEFKENWFEHHAIGEYISQFRMLLHFAAKNPDILFGVSTTKHTKS